MPRFEIEPGQLAAASGSQSQLAGRIMELRGELARASSAAWAAGDPSLSAAITDCLASWSDSLTMLAQSVEGGAGNLSAASTAYTGTDSGAIAP
jgi:hypothetical protein